MQEVPQSGKSNDAPGQQHPVEIILDEVSRTSPTRRLTGRQIRDLGPTDRVDGFETQKLTARGKKDRTIGDTEEVELHEGDRFRTVPNNGGPGAAL